MHVGIILYGPGNNVLVSLLDGRSLIVVGGHQLVLQRRDVLDALMLEGGQTWKRTTVITEGSDEDCRD